MLREPPQRRSQIGVKSALLAAVSAMVVACGGGPADDTTQAGETVGLATPLPSQAPWLVPFTSFDEMVATTDAVAVATVAGSPETSTFGGPRDEYHYDETTVQLRVDEQLYGDRSLLEVIPSGSPTDMYGDGPDQWSEWRTRGQRVVVFLGWFPRLDLTTSGWHVLNGQAIFMLNGDDLETTYPDDELTAEIASWSFEEFGERLGAAAEEAEAGRVTPQPDRRKNLPTPHGDYVVRQENPPSPQIDGESSERASHPPPGLHEERGGGP